MIAVPIGPRAALRDGCGGRPTSIGAGAAHPRGLPGHACLHGRGPFPYYPGRRHLPAPLRALADFIATLREGS